MWKCGWMGELNVGCFSFIRTVDQCRVLRRSRGIGEIAEVEVCAEVEVWMGWRMECRVLRRSGVDSEAMELMQR